MLAYLLPLIPLWAIPFSLMGWVMMGRSGSGETPRQMRQALNQLPPKLAKHRAKLTLHVDVCDTIRQLPLPVPVMHGKRDRLLSHRTISRFLDLRPDAQIVLVDGYHMILETHPKPIAKAIEDFVSILPSTR